MFKVKSFILITILILLTISQSYSKSIKLYISPDGSDQWSGKYANPTSDSTDGPLSSLHKAQQKVREIKKRYGDEFQIEVIVTQGEYFLDKPLIFIDEDSGTDKHPIVYKAAEGCNPVFFGGQRISGFTKQNNGIWSVKIAEVEKGDWYFEQLFVNGQRSIRAKSPNKYFYHFNDVSEEVHIQGTGRFPEKATQHLKVEPDHLQVLSQLSKTELNDVLLTVYHKWDFTRRHIDTFDMKSGSIVTSGQGMKPWNAWKQGQRFILENCKTALDIPGEWFLDRNGVLFYIPREGEKITNTEFIAPVTDKFIIFKGDLVRQKLVSNIKIEGLTFRYANYITPESGFEPNQAANSIDAVVQLDGVRNIKISNCEIGHIGTYAVWFREGCKDSKLENCYIHDLGAGGIRIGESIIQNDLNYRTHHIEINNNIIFEGGRIFPPAVGIWIGHSGDNEISHNDIGDFYYTGISVGWCWGYGESLAKRNIIEFNHIHHIGWGLLSDMGGIYTLGSSEGSVIDHNVLHDIFAHSYGGWGIYPDEGSSYYKITNNLTYRTKTGGFHQHYGRENIVKNNIFALSKLYQLQCTRVEDHQSFEFKNNIIYFEEGVLLDGAWKNVKIDMDYNCFWSNDTSNLNFIGMKFNDWQKTGRDKNSIIADPGFVDPRIGNFSIKDNQVTNLIGFQPFETNLAGVMDKNKWENLGAISEERHEEFLDVVDFKPPFVTIISKYSREKKGYLITIKSENSDGVLYTTDGSTPNMNSNYYKNSFFINDKVIIKAVPVLDGNIYWPVKTFEFSPHKGIGKDVELLNQPHPKYDKGSHMLFDGIFGSKDFSNGKWMGFESDDLVAVIDLGKNRKVKNVTVQCLEDSKSWIFLPKEIIIEVSKNGKKYKQVGKIDNGYPKNDEKIIIKNFNLLNESIKTRYLKITAKNIIECPDWHQGAGGKAWLFVDEIIVE